MVASYPVRPALLPEELLLQVFEDCQDTCREDPSLPPYKWLSITHVCRRWRWWALHCPRLWTQIVVIGTDELTVMLQRSYPLPISVKFGDHIDRFPGHVFDVAFQLIERDRGRVRHLELENMRRREAFVLDEWDSPLESLKLSSYPFRWTDSVLCRSLKKLTIYGLNYPELSAGTPSSLRGMFDALRRMPLLEQINMEHPINPAFLPGHDTGGVVFLPKLRNILLVGSTAWCTLILERISCPTTATYTMMCTGASSLQELRRLSRCLTSKMIGRARASTSISHASFKLFDTLFFNLQGTSFVQFLGWKSYQLPFNVLHRKYELIANLNLCFGWEGSTEVAGRDAMCEALNLLPLANAKNIYFAHAKGEMIYALLSLLSYEAQSTWSSVDTLTLFEVDFSSMRLTPREAFAELSTDLVLRRLDGMTLNLKRLVFSKCKGLDLADVATMIRVVPHVEWDGQKWSCY